MAEQIPLQEDVTLYITPHLVLLHVRGYQFGSTDAFDSSYNTIDSPYVHRVSITYGNNTRKHLWTYAAGIFQNILVSYDCPCNTGYISQYYPPLFVGNHYYCESGNNLSY